MIGEGTWRYDTHDVMYFWASWYPVVFGAGDEGVDASLVSDTESSTTARAPNPVAEDVAPPLFVGAFFAGHFPADLIRDGSDDAAAPVEDAEDVEPCEEEPRDLFVPFLLFLLGAAGGAVVVVGARCPPVAATCCCLAVRLAFFAVVDPCDGGSAFPRAGVSERLANSSAIVSAVGEADDDGAAAAVARGTSTKSAVSDRGDWRGGDVERRAEEERDQTISSSSERESLAHLELEVSERTSREDEREVVVVIGNVERIAGEMEKSIYLIGRRP
jgi:hypothetical protein